MANPEDLEVFDYRVNGHAIVIEDEGGGVFRARLLHNATVAAAGGTRDAALDALLAAESELFAAKVPVFRISYDADKDEILIAGRRMARTAVQTKVDEIPRGQ